MGINDKSTAAFLDENPIYVVITRRKKTPVSGGAWKWEVDSVLPPQRCRQILRDRITDRESTTLSDGRVVTINSTLVFERKDADVQIGDLVELPNNEQHEVVMVRSRYSTNAEVTKNASHP